MTSEPYKIAARALALFDAKFNCAEAVATALTEYFAPLPTCFPKVATCFGGGLGRRGETCGALVGALLAVSAVRGREPGEGDEAKKRCYALAEQVVESFREGLGPLSCRELLGIDLATPEGARAFAASDYHHTHCHRIVAAAARLAAEVLAA